MGYDSQKGFSSVGVDPTWKALLEQLSMKGISAKDIQENEQFIKDFVQQSGGIEAVSLHSILISHLDAMDQGRGQG